MKFLSLFFTFALVLNLTSCSSHKNENASTEPSVKNEPSSESSPPNKDKEKLFESEMQVLKSENPSLAEMINNPCIKDGSCPSYNIKAGEAPNKNEQILILEAMTFPESSFTRYQNRVSGFYHYNEDGTYRRITPRAKVAMPDPNLFKNINSMNLQFGREYFQRKFPTIGYYLADNLNIDYKIDLENSIHGWQVFEFLVERNPDTNFVFANFPYFNSKEEVCGLLTKGDKSEIYLRGKIEKYAESLSEVIKTHKVKYVNASFGWGLPNIQQFLSIKCGSTANLQKAKKLKEILSSLLIKLLEMNSDIIIVNSVINEPEPGYSCDVHERLIRVGFFNQINSTIPPDGVSFADVTLPRFLENAKYCIDVMVNGGIIESNELNKSTKLNEHFPKYFDKNSLMFNWSGYFNQPIDVMATSWAAPIALSMLRSIHKDTPAYEVRSKILLQAFDPVRNNQFVGK